MKNLLSGISALLLAVPAAAAPSLESAQAAALKSFQMPAARISFQKGAKVEGALPGKAVAQPAQAKASGYVSVSGYVNFNGSGFVSHTPGYASLNMTGTANLCDSTGQVCSGYTMITTWANVFVNGNFVNDWLRPYVTVSFYKGGRYVGSGQVSGSVPVSGWINGGWVNLSGSGYLNGSVFVNEPAASSRQPFSVKDIFSVDPKIQVNEAQDDMDGTLVLALKGGENIDATLKALKDAGYDAGAFTDDLGGYLVMVNAAPAEAAAKAKALARYAFVRQVLVSRKVFAELAR